LHVDVRVVAERGGRRGLHRCGAHQSRVLARFDEIVHQLGVAWYRGTLTRARWQAWALLGGGLTALVVLTGWGPYAVTMVGGAPAPALANTAPPTLALLALASAQTGAVLLLRRPADRWMRRPRPWLAVVAVNAVVLTVYLWHMVPVVIAGTTLVAGGVLPQREVLRSPFGWGGSSPKAAYTPADSRTIATTRCIMVTIRAADAAARYLRKYVSVLSIQSCRSGLNTSNTSVSSSTSTWCGTFGGICMASPVRTTNSRPSIVNRSAPRFLPPSCASSAGRIMI